MIDEMKDGSLQQFPVNVSDLGDDYRWKNGIVVTHLLESANKPHEVIMILPFESVEWKHSIKACHKCMCQIKDADAIICTEKFWIYPCKSCEEFVWYTTAPSRGETDAFQ